MAVKEKSKAPPKVVAKKEKKVRTGTCLWSGETTGGGNFRPGYDAKMKGLLIRVTRGEAKLSEIPNQALVTPLLKREEGLVGFRLEGGKLVKIGNFTIGDGKSKKSNGRSVSAKAEKVETGKKGKAALKQKAPPPVEDDEDEVFEDDEE